MKVEAGGKLVPYPSDPRSFIHSDVAALRDEQLGELMGSIQSNEGRWFLVACLVCAEFKRRYAREQNWVDLARDYINKRPASIYLYATVWDTWSLAEKEGVYDLDEALKLRKGVLQIVAQVSQEKRMDALREVVHLLAEGRDPGPALVRRHLRERGYLPPLKTPRRYTVVQLRELLTEYSGDCCTEPDERGGCCCRAERGFLNWIEEQEKDKEIP